MNEHTFEKKKKLFIVADFVFLLRQIPPVVTYGQRRSIVAASFKSSSLWSYFEEVELITPQRDADDPRHSQFVDSVGDGSIIEYPPNSGWAKLDGYNTLTNDEASEARATNCFACFNRRL